MIVTDNENGSDCSENIPLAHLANAMGEVEESSCDVNDDEDNDPDWEMGEKNNTSGESDSEPTPSCSKSHCAEDTTEIPSITCSEQQPLGLRRPEDYQVEGPRRVTSGHSPAKQQKRSEKENIRKLVKEKRNMGLPYISEKTQRIMPARRALRPRCTSSACDKNQLRCSTISEEHRTLILNTYYSLGDLSKQRQWIANHVIPVQVAQPKSQTSRRGRTLKYTLPLEDNAHVPVCKVTIIFICRVLCSVSLFVGVKL